MPQTRILSHFGFQKHVLNFKTFWPQQVLKFEQIRTSISHLSATDTYWNLSCLFTTNSYLNVIHFGVTSTLLVPHVPKQFDLQSTQIINCVFLTVPLPFLRFPYLSYGSPTFLTVPLPFLRFPYLSYGSPTFLTVPLSFLRFPYLSYGSPTFLTVPLPFYFPLSVAFFTLILSQIRIQNLHKFL